MLITMIVPLAVLASPSIETELDTRSQSRPEVPDAVPLEDGAAPAHREAALGAGVSLGESLRLHGRIRRTLVRLDLGDEQLAVSATRALVFLTAEPGVGPLLLHAGISWEAQ